MHAGPARYSKLQRYIAGCLCLPLRLSGICTLTSVPTRFYLSACMSASCMRVYVLGCPARHRILSRLTRSAAASLRQAGRFQRLLFDWPQQTPVHANSLKDRKKYSSYRRPIFFELRTREIIRSLKHTRSSGVHWSGGMSVSAWPQCMHVLLCHPCSWCKF